MDLSAYKAISINGIAMKKITIGGVVAWERPMINWVRRSINADGTIYNNGLGYKNGYRVRSGGAEAESTYASTTGYMKVKAGDIVRISGFDFSRVSNVNSINAANASFTNIGQFTTQPAYYGIFATEPDNATVVEEKTGVWKWVVPSEGNVAYIRLTGQTGEGTITADGSKMIVTINEEIA